MLWFYDYVWLRSMHLHDNNLYSLYTYILYTGDVGSSGFCWIARYLAGNKRDSGTGINLDHLSNIKPVPSAKSHKNDLSRWQKDAKGRISNLMVLDSRWSETEGTSLFQRRVHGLAIESAFTWIFHNHNPGKSNTVTTRCFSLSLASSSKYPCCCRVTVTMLFSGQCDVVQPINAAAKRRRRATTPRSPLKRCRGVAQT